MGLVGNRRGELVRQDNREGQVHLEFTIPARGLIGLRTRMMTATQGQAIMHHNFHEYAAMRGRHPGPNQWCDVVERHRQGQFVLDEYAAGSWRDVC